MPQHIVSILKAFLILPFFVLLLEIIHEATLHLESFTWLLLMLFQSYFLLQILICLVVCLLA